MDCKKFKIVFIANQKYYIIERTEYLCMLFVFVLRFQIFILRVERENQKVPSYIFRHFSEFVEFRNKLMEMYPLISWPHLSSK